MDDVLELSYPVFVFVFTYRMLHRQLLYNMPLRTKAGRFFCSLSPLWPFKTVRMTLCNGRASDGGSVNKQRDVTILSSDRVVSCY